MQAVSSSGVLPARAAVVRAVITCNVIPLVLKALDRHGGGNGVTLLMGLRCHQCLWISDVCVCLKVILVGGRFPATRACTS